MSLLVDPAKPWPVVPLPTLDNPLQAEIKLADIWFSRLRGLLGSAVLLPHQGLLISPCRSIHTMGMKYALDIVFLGQDGTILKLVTQLPPWRRRCAGVPVPPSSWQRAMR